MRIALLLSGKTTCWKEAAPYIHRNIIENNDVDVYFHTWYDQETPKKIQEIYCIKNYIQTPYPSDQEKTLCQFFSFNRSLELVNDDYDFYIKCRWDVFIKNPINFSLLLDKKMYFLPHGRPGIPNTSEVWKQKYGIHTILPKDFIFIFKKEHITSLYKLEDVINLYNRRDNIDICAEDILFHHITKQDIDIGIIPNQDENGLVRPKNHHQGEGILLYNSFGWYKYNV